MSTFSRALHYDLVTLSFGLEDFNSVAFKVTLSLTYIIYYFYFHAPQTNNDLLTQIVLTNNCSFFIYKFDNKVTKCSPSGERINQALRCQLKIAFNVVQSFRVALQFFSIFVHLVMTQIVIRHSKNSSTIEKLLFNGVIICSGTATNCYSYYFASKISLIISVGMLQLRVLIVKLKQLYTYLERCNTATSFTSARFSKFHIHLIDIFSYFTEYNTVYGRIFVVYLAVNTPVNVEFVSILVFDRSRLTAIGALYMMAYTTLQTVCIFAIQYYFVRFSVHLHAPSGLLNRLQIKHMHKLGDVKMRLKVANTVVAFLTDRPYGITYERFGMVTMKTFALFLILWSKAFLITYKIIKQI